MDSEETGCLIDAGSSEAIEEAIPESRDLSTHKARLVEAAAKIDLLEPLRKHPYSTVAAAAAFGAALANPQVVVAAKLMFAPKLLRRALGLVGGRAAAMVARHLSGTKNDSNRL